ncbi:MAG: ABC transporter ATP-binding protein [Candidatus Bipolaricaulota bacterium]
MSVLRTEALERHFGGLVAVHDLTFELTEREILGIIGPNGAGKTTVINLISGLYMPNGGRILLDERDITYAPPHERCRRGIARTFQLVHPLADLTAQENIMVGALFGQRQSLRAARRTAAEIGRLLDLRAMNRPVSDLTVLEVKKLEIGRALATRPKVLFLDEVMAGLNSDETKAMLASVRIVREQGVSICVVEHVMSVIRDLTDRVIVLDGGTLIAQGPYCDVSADPRVIVAYLGEEETC